MKDKIISILFVLSLFTIGISYFVLSDNDISFYERRKLMTNEKLKEDFFENLDDYMSDQFPLRDEFISINSVIYRYLFKIKDKNDVYVINDYLIEKNYPYNELEVNSFINKINYINDKYLDKSNVFYSIIPDKSYYLNDKYLKMDFTNIEKTLKDKLNINYIDIMDSFVLEDYFKTDIHLKQDSYFKIMNKFDKYLNFGYKNLKYQKNTYNDFYGASVGKVGSYISSENMDYFTNSLTNKVKVKHLEYGNREVYDLSKLNDTDKYNIFLSGPSSLIEIENENSFNDNELIIFRDSFASSLTPLLIPYFKKITLIDLRYINADLLPNYLNFKDKDIIFLYSTLIINNSSLLKVTIPSK